MDYTHILSCQAIGLGAIIMLWCIFKSKTTLDYLPFVRLEGRVRIRRLVRMKRIFMFLFLIGYIAVGTSIITDHHSLGDFVVGIIFLLVAIFVYVAIGVELRLLSEVHKTLNGLLPICASCKKVREPDASPDDPESWGSIEKYIGSREDVDLTHGYCPDCYEAIMGQQLEPSD
ncbi:hypothetical protein BVX97_02330 [bacterium E08(2017)]|nr:hypothetical protein BVX97_02330 [bacterium E08(2017)]